MLIRAIVLVPLLLAGARAADEARFDPPLDGVFLGVAGAAQAGRLLVQSVEPGSAAMRAGLEPGDEIARLGPAEGFGSFEEFSRALRTLRPGEEVEVQVLRRGKPASLKLVPD